jgi:hypothetical protein
MILRLPPRKHDELTIKLILKAASFFALFQGQVSLAIQPGPGLCAGTVRGRPLTRRLQQLRHRGRAVCRVLVRRRAIRTGLP